MILEIARFLASICSYNQAIDRYEILGVMGPDEYHDSYPDSDTPGLNNNAYTNVMSAEELKDLFRKMGYEFDPQIIPKNIDYYLKRSSPGSTLSNIVHSWVLARSDRALLGAFPQGSGKRHIRYSRWNHA